MTKNFNQSTEIKMERELEALIDKIIKRKVRRIEDNLNTIILGASQKHFQKSTRDLGQVLFGRNTDFAESSTQLFSQLAQHMSKAFAKNG